MDGKTIVIASSPFKCPAAPYEAAFLIRNFLNKRNPSAQIAVVTPEPYPMPTAGPGVGEALRAMLESKGVQFFPNHKVARIDPDRGREGPAQSRGIGPFSGPCGGRQYSQ